jgi:hypothetical protein
MNATTKAQIKAFWFAVLAWMSTPTSKAGIAVILTTLLGTKVSPATLELWMTLVPMLAGCVLIAYPQQPKP